MARLIPVAVFATMTILYGLVIVVAAPWLLGAVAHAMWQHFLQGWAA